MSGYGAGMLTVIHDPTDDPQLTHTALAAHNPQLGQITLHPTTGTTSASMLALDIIGALGARIREHTVTEQHLSTSERAYAAAATWLTLDRIDVMIVLRGHLLSDSARIWLARLATDARLRVIVLWHGRRREWAEAFRHPPSMISEREELGAALAGARRRHTPFTHPAEPQPLPSLNSVPQAGLARFRAEAHRTLPADQFAALDCHYRHGMQEACRFLTGHRPPPVPPVDASTSAPIAAGTGCLGHALGRERPHPLPFGDLAGLQGFLTQLTGTSPAPAATIARVRGAQAGMLAHGIALQVPVELKTAHGPGVTGTRVCAQRAADIRRVACHPQIAAALAIAAFTGLSAEELARMPVAEPPEGSLDVQISYLIVAGVPVHYHIPEPARPLLDAAAHFLRTTGRSTLNLLRDVTARQIKNTAIAAGINLAPGSHHYWWPWHAQAAAWYVGEPLHGAKQRAEPLHGEAAP